MVSKEKIELLRQKIDEADAIVVGGASGMSAASGFVFYYQEDDVFRRMAGGLAEKYDRHNMFDLFYYRRPSQVMKDLLAVVGDKDYFVLTSNADTHLELSGFAPGKVFEVEGTFEDMLHNRPMQLAAREPQATYIMLNLAQELYIPNEIAYTSIGLDGDIAVTLQKLILALCRMRIVCWKKIRTIC